MTLQSPRKLRENRCEKIAVVIPCYQVERSILDVLEGIGHEVDFIFCVDDASTDETTAIINDYRHADRRVTLIRRQFNGGVGAAVLDGYRAAIDAGAGVIVKIDGDGQMDPALIESFCQPILNGAADYVKGNRFFFLENVRAMPRSRILGNAGLSFLTKLSTGYWNSFDPTNGFTAIHSKVAAALPFDRIHKRYFFESDLLFRLGILRARVVDLPMQCVYGDETSNLSVGHCLLTFPGLHVRNTLRRIAYNYFLHDFSIASVNLLIGLMLCGFGSWYGAVNWMESASSGQVASAGTVMTAALPVILGFQLLLNALSCDISMTPREPLHTRLTQATSHKAKEADRRSHTYLPQEPTCLPK